MTTTDAIRAGHLQSLYANARALETHETEREGMLNRRRRLILAAHGMGATRNEIAAAAGLTPQRVSQILHKERYAQ